MKRLKVLFIVSDLNKSLQFEWMTVNLKDKIDLSFILLGEKDTPFHLFLKMQNIKVFHVPLTTRVKPFACILENPLVFVDRPTEGCTHSSSACQLGRLTGCMVSWNKKKDLYPPSFCVSPSLFSKGCLERSLNELVCHAYNCAK